LTDYVNNWHRVWSQRKPAPEQAVNALQQLIALDGFDSPLGAMSENDWKTYVDVFAKRCGLSAGDSIFEVGCGSGAFLFPFHQQGHAVGGIDYSEELILVAQSYMPERRGEFSVLEAKEFSELPVDVVVANHVIHYFSSLTDAETVVSKMLRKAVKSVCVSGVPDVALRVESERERRGILMPDEYEAKYAGLEILYYDRKFFIELAKAYSFNVRFFDHGMPGFAQNRFRFDCLMTRC
jgi:ubiquinone/menaquinone biosynthesis C-methylase UbiE